MMSNTPRVFVGTTTFLVTGMTSSDCLLKVTAAMKRVCGGTSTERRSAHRARHGNR